MSKVLVCIFILLLSSSQVFGAYSATKIVKEEIAVDEIKNQNLSEESTWHHFTKGMNSCLLSLLYTPVKVHIALIGGVVGGLSYPFAGFNANVSKKIWDSSMGGTYLITEDILDGEDKAVLFFKKSKN